MLQRGEGTVTAVVRYLSFMLLATVGGTAFAQGLLVLGEPPLLNVDEHGRAHAHLSLIQPSTVGGIPS